MTMIAEYGIIISASGLGLWRLFGVQVISQVELPPGTAKWLDQGVMGALVLLLVFFLLTLWRTNQDLVKKLVDRDEKATSLAEKLIVSNEAMKMAAERLVDVTEICRNRNIKEK